jgi:hypothetical protein
VNKLSKLYTLTPRQVEIILCYQTSLEIRVRSSEGLTMLQQWTTVNSFTFIEILKKLQPEKKWTIRKEKYGLQNNIPIHGILFKLAGNAAAKGNKKRLKILGQMAGLKHSARVNLPLEKNVSRKLMLSLLRNKF